MSLISELQSKNKHLSDLLANQDKEVDGLRDLLGKDWHKWVSRTEIKPFDIMLSH